MIDLYYSHELKHVRDRLIEMVNKLIGYQSKSSINFNKIDTFRIQ